MYILLIRHGTAQAETAFITNRYRDLTEDGKKDVEITSKIIMNYFSDKKFKIHTSPYLRTRKTAEIFAKISGTTEVINARELQQKEWFRTETLLEENVVNVLVSHHPFIQSYLTEITGAYIPVQTASCLIIDYDKFTRKGKLVSYITAEMKKQ